MRTYRLCTVQLANECYSCLKCLPASPQHLGSLSPSYWCWWGHCHDHNHNHAGVVRLLSSSWCQGHCHDHDHNHAGVVRLSSSSWCQGHCRCHRVWAVVLVVTVLVLVVLAVVVVMVQWASAVVVIEHNLHDHAGGVRRCMCSAGAKTY